MVYEGCKKREDLLYFSTCNRHLLEVSSVSGLTFTSRLLGVSEGTLKESHKVPPVGWCEPVVSG